MLEKIRVIFAIPELRQKIFLEQTKEQTKVPGTFYWTSERLGLKKQKRFLTPYSSLQSNGFSHGRDGRLEKPLVRLQA